MKPMLMERGVIVSCQAYPGDPMYGDGIMAHMAKAAALGGAVGIRANGYEDIRDIKSAVNLPVIGLIKRRIEQSEIYITPEWRDAELILEAGADIVALDVTLREDRIERVCGIIQKIHQAGALVMADISTLEEGIAAEQLGADMISTTLSGYTPYSPQHEQPDLSLVRDLTTCVNVPVVAEGRISSPEMAASAFEAGAKWVVVGSAITRPEHITKRFTERALRVMQR